MTPTERAEFWMCLIVEARKNNTTNESDALVNKLFALVAEDMGVDVDVLKVLVN